MSDLTKISVIIVSYHNREQLRETLDTLLFYHKNIELEIIVVDNSLDDTIQSMINSDYREVDYKKSPSNLGFGKANNIGIEKAKNEFIALVNSDIIFLEDTLNQLVDILKSKPSFGAIGPKLLNYDKTLQYSCCHFPEIKDIISSEFFGNPLPSNWYLTDIDHDKPLFVDYLSGALIVFNSTLLKKLCFDDNFFMYSEEVDLCYRIKQLGYEIYYYPGTKAIHLGGGSTVKSEGINHHLYLSRIKFRLKYYGKIQALLHSGLLLLASLARIVILSLRQIWSRRDRNKRHYRIKRSFAVAKLMVIVSFLLLIWPKNKILEYRKNG